MCMNVDSLLLSASWSQLHITYANLPLEAAENLHPAFFFLTPQPWQPLPFAEEETSHSG